MYIRRLDSVDFEINLPPPREREERGEGGREGGRERTIFHDGRNITIDAGREISHDCERRRTSLHKNTIY
jgi:hypothetical protein